MKERRISKGMSGSMGKQREQRGAAKARQASPPETKPQKTAMAVMREWTDAIIIAYILAMFIRTFVVELFKIPSGSMTPTLVGDYVAEVDFDGNGFKDLLVQKSDPPVRASGFYQVFLRNAEGWEYKGEQTIETAVLNRLAMEQESSALKRWIQARLGWKGPIHRRYDKIFVNKFAYWFSPPDRGDLVVFKVPSRIWTEERPIYIKRAVAFGGETVTFESDESCPEDKGRLAVNGQIAYHPRVFRNLCYAWRVDMLKNPPPENEFLEAHGRELFVRCQVPADHLLALGDNTDSSFDGRYWGAVPLENLKGKAFFRYSPLSKIGFLN